MTGMQLIIPLLEEDDNPQHGDMSRSDGPRRTTNDQGFGEDSSHRDRVLPQDLRESFQAMKSLWRQVDRKKEEESAATDELRRKEREQAVATALAIEAEVAKWQNSIAELEAMLSAPENEDDNEENYGEQEEEGSFGDDDRPMPLFRFPSLPPIIVPEEEDHDETSITRSGSQTDFSDSPGLERISG